MNYCDNNNKEYNRKEVVNRYMSTFCCWSFRKKTRLKHIHWIYFRTYATNLQNDITCIFLKKIAKIIFSTGKFIGKVILSCTNINLMDDK